MRATEQQLDNLRKAVHYMHEAQLQVIASDFASALVYSLQNDIDRVGGIIKRLEERSADKT